MSSTARLAALITVALTAQACLPTSWTAPALLHPQRRSIAAEPALAHRDVTFESEGITLSGWLFPAAAARRGVTVVYLHGIADNRASGTWIAEQLVVRGFDVLAYDSRAHGASGGDACTYGVHEKRDLARALGALGVERAILVGVSLGAAVAIQEAADDPRVAGIVSVATFSDLQSIASDRAPWFATRWDVRAACTRAGELGGFRPEEASPVRSAAHVHVPVLMVHGAADRETRPAHSERVYAALTGPKRLLLVPDASHSDALGKAWPEVAAWIDEVAASPRRR